MLDIVVLVVLIGLNGVLAMSEVALIASRRARLQNMEEEGYPGAARAKDMNADPNRALSTIQVGITSVGLLSGIFGESALAKPVSMWLQSLGVGAETASIVSLVAVVMLLTYFSIVLGELVPKRIGQLSPEALACRVSPWLYRLSVIATPFVKLLSESTSLILRALHINTSKQSAVTEEEIHAMIDEGEESGIIETAERDMVRNVFRLDDRQVASLMTPRSDIEWIDLEDSREVNVEKIRSSNRSRLPVCEGSLDNVKGFCSTRTLLQQMMEKGKANFNSNLTNPVYVPESLTGMELLENFRKTDTQVALVVNEYGEVQGIVSPRDVLEAIAGEFKPEEPEDAWITKREDGSLLLDGMIPIPELKDVLDWKHMPEEEEGRYNTLAGFLMLLLGRLPREGDVCEWNNWRFEIVDMDGRRIDKVLVSHFPMKDDKTLS